VACRARLAFITNPRSENVVKRPVALLAVAALPLSAIAATEIYPFDPLHTSVSFAIDHLGLSMIHGRFSKYSGKFTIDRAAKTGNVELVVQTASVDTNDNDKGNRPRSRDEHLRSSDFFNVAEFPTMTYKSTNVVFAGDTPTTVEGNLTLLGVTKPVAITIDRFRCNPATATAKERCGGSASAKIKRSDFGMKRGIPNIGDDVALAFGFEGDKE
jgi:polyisoprenoid-binding protein YceI